MYIFNLIREIRIWLKIKKIAKQNEEKLNKNGFRVDWIGRIYTVVNLPEEVVTAPISQEGYVLMKLREFDKVFLEIGIADYVFPEFEKIENTDSYLLVISPNSDYLRFWPFMKFLFRIFLLLVGLRILYKIFLYFNINISWLLNIF